MKNKYFLIFVVTFISTMYLKAQSNKDSVSLKTQKSLLQIESSVNKSLSQSKPNKVIDHHSTSNKAKNQQLKSVSYKLDITKIKSSFSNKDNSISNKLKNSRTTGKKKLIKHSPTKPKAISEKSKLELKKLLGLGN